MTTGRPHISDAFGPISGFDSLRIEVSAGLKLRAMKLAHQRGFRSVSSFGRDLIEKEVMASTVQGYESVLRTENGRMVLEWIKK